jgi:excisionase family DNA binding protein
MMSQRAQRYASPATTAAYLGASLSTVNRLAKESVLHPTRIGRRVFFDLAEVDEVMASGRARNGGAVESLPAVKPGGTG